MDANPGDDTSLDFDETDRVDAVVARSFEAVGDAIGCNALAMPLPRTLVDLLCKRAYKWWYDTRKATFFSSIIIQLRNSRK